MKYYIAENGQQAGPFEPSELLAHGLTANSLVWCEGMPSWVSASQVPELMALLSGNPVDMGNIDVNLPPVPPVGGEVNTPPVGVDVNLPQTPPMSGEIPLPQMPTPQQPTTPTTPYNPDPTTNQPVNFPQAGPSTTNQPLGATPKTWLIESVIATVLSFLCCGAGFIGLIPGAIAIFNAWGSKTCYTKGDTAGGDKKAASAKMWTLITAVVGIGFAIYTAIQMMNNPNLIQDMQNNPFGLMFGIK